MRALVFDGQLHLETSLPIPQKQNGDALLKIRCAGICNTDLELMDGMYGFSGILGHEFVAEVIEGQPDLIGKRVVGEISVVCGHCDFCQQGIPSQCRSRTTIGIRRYPGAFADYLPLPPRNLHIVSDRITDDQAVFVEPLAAALQVTEGIHISPRDRVVVVGVGKLGMLVAQVLKLTGADVVGVVRREKQAKLLARWGVPAVELRDLPEQSADVVVDVTGLAQGFADALWLVKSRGTIVLKSTYNDFPQVDMTQVAVREIRVIGSRCGPFDAALRLLERDLIDVNSLIDGRYPFDEAVTAMHTAAQPGAMKYLLDF
ncbi:MAG: alcohol dehydrogenase catalytic domain-containing protein [Chloroflexi bacterium]|nr:alcohol dehydrogenase catalytic domain-containing protein [Chloroflexota bacterium]MCC6893492.1 alcohol dehydrogenase catalytic domain-containing protein [Anaerolineae bacterium]